MKFKYTPKFHAQLGDKRVIREFAWWPTKLHWEERTIIWLEYYYSHQKFGSEDGVGLRRFCTEFVWQEIFKHSQNQWGLKG